MTAPDGCRRPYPWERTPWALRCAWGSRRWTVPASATTGPVELIFDGLGVNEATGKVLVRACEGEVITPTPQSPTDFELLARQRPSHEADRELVELDGLNPHDRWSVEQQSVQLRVGARSA
jgi:hypothetical protein